jgi:hypothetical protein
VGPAQGVGVAGGSLSRVVPGRGGSSPDEAGAAQYRQMGRVR